MAGFRAVRGDRTSSTTLLPPGVILRCASRADYRRRSFTDLGEEELWTELVRCMLSSNVRWELADELTGRLRERGLLEGMKDMASSNLSEQVRSILSGTKSGTQPRDRSHRYPERATKLVTDAATKLYDGRKDQTLSGYLQEARDVQDARELLLEVPGIGMKQSSLFLRRVGFSTEVLVVDRHILHFSETVLGWSVPRLTGRVYLKLEERFRELAECRGLSLGSLDEAIWEYMRESL